jgi:hypothetical protein
MKARLRGRQNAVAKRKTLRGVDLSKSGYNRGGFDATWRPYRGPFRSEPSQFCAERALSFGSPRHSSFAPAPTQKGNESSEV